MTNEIFEQRAIGAQSVLGELLEANAGNSVEDLYIAINASHATISAVLAWYEESSGDAEGEPIW